MANKNIPSREEIIRQELENAGDAIALDDLVSILPYLNSDIIDVICKENINDCISFLIDNVKYLKLLDFYYLPDDFSEQLQNIIAEYENNYTSVSLSQIILALVNCYGDGFLTDYALVDENSLICSDR